MVWRTLSYDESLSNFAFNFNLRRYTKASMTPIDATVIYACSARVLSEWVVQRPMKRFFLAVSAAADCSDAYAAEVLWSPEVRRCKLKPVELVLNAPGLSA